MKDDQMCTLNETQTPLLNALDIARRVRHRGTYVVKGKRDAQRIAHLV